MIKKNCGYALAIIGLIGFGFFNTYKGSVIPYPALWLCLSILIGFAGLYLVYITRSQDSPKQEKYNEERLAKLKQNGEKVLLTVDNCEIRENNYYQEVTNESYSRIKQIDAVYEPNRNYKQEFIEQSAVIYYHNINGMKHRMTSQSFSINANTLSKKIEDKKLFLYINRHNPNDYVFVMIG